MSKLVWFLFILAGLSLMGGRYALGYWDNWLWMPLLLSILTFAIGLFLDFKTIVKIIKMRNSKYGVSVLGLVLMVLAILILCNYVIWKLDISFDITKNKNNSLKEESIQILKQVQLPLKIIAFYEMKDAAKKEEAYRLLSQFSALNNKIQYEFKDPNLFPALRKEYNVDESVPTFIIKYDGKQNRILDTGSQGISDAQLNSVREEDLIYAILKVTKKSEKLLCYIVGHSEKDITDSTDVGASQFAKALDNLSYKIENLSLISVKEIPERCNLAVMMGPETPVENQEYEILKNYMASGGRLFLAIDPGMRHNLARFTKLFGFTFSNQYIVDVAGQNIGANAAITIGATYNPEHLITNRFKNATYTFFPLASDLKLDEVNPNIKNQVLVQSGEVSYLKHEINSSLSINENVDTKGPFAVAVAVEGKLSPSQTKDFQLVLISDSDFIVNQMFGKGYNQDLTLNAIAYLGGDTSMIGDSKSKTKTEVLILTQTQYSILIIITFLFSASLLSSAILLFVQNRRKA